MGGYDQLCNQAQWPSSYPFQTPPPLAGVPPPPSSDESPPAHTIRPVGLACPLADICSPCLPAVCAWNPGPTIHRPGGNDYVGHSASSLWHARSGAHSDCGNGRSKLRYCSRARRHQSRCDPAEWCATYRTNCAAHARRSHCLQRASSTTPASGERSRRIGPGPKYVATYGTKRAWRRSWIERRSRTSAIVWR